MKEILAILEILHVTTSFGYRQAMEFSCKHLQELLKRLNKDEILCTWTAHKNKFGQTTVSMRFTPPKLHKSSITRESLPSLLPSEPSSVNEPESRNSTELPTRDSSELSDGQSQQSKSTNSQETMKESPSKNTMNDEPVASSEPVGSPILSGVEKVVFKPASSYQLKRDKERLHNFKSRYQTRSSKRQSEQSGPASAENKRDRDSTSSDILCISPVHLPNSPFEDPNPFSPLLETACDSPPSSDSLSESEDMYEAPQPTVEPCDSVEEAYKSDQRQQMFNEGLCEALRVIERDKLENPDNCPIT